MSVHWIKLAQVSYQWQALANTVMNVGFEVFTAVVMNCYTFWLRPASLYVGFEVFTAVVMKSIIFWDMTPCSPSSFN
jgi:hypothetical protein